MNLRFRQIVLSWDFWAALGASAVVCLLLPSWITHTFAGSIYEMGINVLSIVFAVFFTALAVLIAAGDDEFVGFLRELDIYTKIVFSYRFTLLVLFAALLFSIVAFAGTVAMAEQAENGRQSKYIMAVYSFFFFYGLFAVINSTHDALEYARRRVEFVEFKRKSRGSSPPRENGE